MRRDWLLICIIAAVAAGVRIYPAWDTVFGGSDVNFLETDAWYHVRLVENQVRNYPWRVAVDPYAASGGQFVPIAPLFDTLTATVVVTLHGRHADTASVERVAAFIPPLLGTLTVVATWALARRLWDRRAGLLAAALLAILPGHFLDRTTLGFVDHHALEACLAIVTLWAIVRAMEMTPRAPQVAAPRHRTEVEAVSAPNMADSAPLIAGVALGLYLLGWSSGAFLIGIVGLWFLLLIPLARTQAVLTHAGRVVGLTALVALVLVVTFQDPRMHRYGSQIIGLIGLAILGFATTLLAGRASGGVGKRLVIGGVALIASVTAAFAWALAPDLLSQLAVDLLRLAPDPARMGVLEARPLFLYSGAWNWLQPWAFFRTGFYIGLIALAPLGVQVWRRRQPGDFLIWVFAVVTFVATVGQNRFGYYLVTACALLGGWLATRILDWGGVPHALDKAPVSGSRVPLHREIAVILVAGAMFAPNLAPSVLLAPRTPGLAAYWQDTMMWLRRETPPPFLQSVGVGDEYYLARYPRDAAPLPDYTVMNWWDQGYWLIQRARRVPVSNPTQERAPNAARFYAAIDEAQAIAILHRERARFVVSDWELPFRLTPEGTIMGRFQNVLDWAGGTHADYYEIYYRRAEGGWTPQWIFHEPYYRSMAYRLSVLGGERGTPDNATTVMTVADRVDTSGRPFREVLTEHTYATYQAAQSVAASSGAAHTIIVGLDPWRTAFPLEPLTSIVKVHDTRSAEQKPTEAPWVRVFERRAAPAFPDQ